MRKYLLLIPIITAIAYNIVFGDKMEDESILWINERVQVERIPSNKFFSGLYFQAAWCWSSKNEILIRKPSSLTDTMVYKDKLYVVFEDGITEKVKFLRNDSSYYMGDIIVTERYDTLPLKQERNVMGVIDLKGQIANMIYDKQESELPDSIKNRLTTYLESCITEVLDDVEYTIEFKVIGAQNNAKYRVFAKIDLLEKNVSPNWEIQAIGYLIDMDSSNIVILQRFCSMYGIFLSSCIDMDKDSITDIFILWDDGSWYGAVYVIYIIGHKLVIFDSYGGC